jgi:hypothetical protein
VSIQSEKIVFKDLMSTYNPAGVLPAKTSGSLQDTALEMVPSAKDSKGKVAL